MVDLVRPRFRLGRTVATPAALKAIQQAGQSPVEFLNRHVCGDWGDLCADDRALNDEAIQDGSRIMSAYSTRAGEKIWIITEAADEDDQREATTILLPDEY
jgi:hypothetical protein